MKLIFASSYHYPAHPAQFRHGLLMARAYAKILSERFMYFVMFEREGVLQGVRFHEMNPNVYKIRKKKLLTVYLFLQYIFFFSANANWRGRDTVIITQESKIALLLLAMRLLFRFRVIYECHGLHSPLSDGFVCRYSDIVIFVTKISSEEARLKWKVRESKILPNAVELPIFEDAKQYKQSDLRRMLGLPESAILVGYVGRFYAMNQDKGVEISLRALRYVKNVNVKFCFVGGTVKEIAHFSAVAQRLGVADRSIFVPYQNESKRVAEYIATMDILMYVPPPVKFFLEETSPMKIYEYMAVEKPIIVADYPALREILDESTAYFIQGELETGLASAIHEVTTKPEEARRRALCAYKRVEGYSWHKRAKAIIDLAEWVVMKN